MLRILSIGNSFSQDAHAMLSGMTKQAGLKLDTVNLYIPGCSLRRHWEGIATGNRDALYEHNGETTDRHISICEALALADWDIITLQQASHHSGEPATYFPYLTQLSRLAHKYAPHARQYLHETWAYERDSDHPKFMLYDCDQRRMFETLRAANHRAAAKTGLPIIPAGEMIQALRALPSFDLDRGGRRLTRDGFHLDLTYGRWALSALWLEVLASLDARTLTFAPPEAEPALLKQIAETVHSVAQSDL